MKRYYLPTLVALVALVIAAPAPAAKVKVWQHVKPGDYDKAQFKHAVVSSEGTLRLARQLRPLADLKASFVWDLAEDKQGNLYVATGDEGKIFKVTPDGKTTVAFASAADSQVLSLCVTPDGTIYAGTGPRGNIVRIAPGGAAKAFAEGLDSYVWSLAFDPATQTLFAGTGPKGKIYQVRAAGKSEVYYATRQDHILALAQSGKALFAGTDKGGLVYRIDAKDKGFVLYQAQQAEVRSLLVAGDVLYAGTSTPNLKRPPTGGGFKSTPSGITPMGGTGANQTDQADQTKAKAQFGADAPASTSGVGSAETKGTPAAAPSQPVVGDNSLYRIAADGTVREVFREKLLILSLLKHQGRLLAGTGMQGQLFEIDDTTKEKLELARLDHGVIQCLLQRKDGSVVVGAGDPGKLYVLDDAFAAAGTVVSDVLDAKIISLWGTMNWKAVTPAGTSISVAVRSGNVAEPDTTWSAWSAEQDDAQAAKALAPTARFLQYRVTLKTTNPKATPEFRHMTLRYKTTNQAPEITLFDVPDLDAAPQDNPKKFRLRWNATDANEDELAYALYFRKDGWKDWVLLEDNLDKKDFEWDTTTIPSGLYQFKVSASDRRDNSPDDARTVERSSPLVPVAHLPPAVTVKLAGWDGDQPILEATAADPLVRLTEAAYSIDGKRWANIFPSDGLFDSKSETFRFKLDAVRPGTHILVLRARNAAGSLGAGDVVFRLPAGK